MRAGGCGVGAVTDILGGVVTVGYSRIVGWPMQSRPPDAVEADNARPRSEAPAPQPVQVRYWSTTFLTGGRIALQSHARDVLNLD